MKFPYEETNSMQVLCYGFEKSFKTNITQQMYSI